MTSAEREQLGWAVSESVAEKFEERIIEEYGKLNPFVNVETERAMREFIDEDEFAELEDRINKLTEAIGHSQTNDLEKNQYSHTSRKKVWYSVHADLKDKFGKWADDHGTSKGKALTRALQEYNHGGRAQRLKETLTPEIIDEIQSIAEELQSETATGINHTEQVTIAIAEELGKQFQDDELADAIDRQTSGSEYYHGRYAPRVIERKEVWRVEKQDNPDLYLKPEQWVRYKAKTVIDNLRIDPESPTKPVSKSSLVRALNELIIEPAQDEYDLTAAEDQSGNPLAQNKQDIYNLIKDDVIDRIDYKKTSDDQYLPEDVNESSSNNTQADEFTKLENTDPIRQGSGDS